MSCAAGAASVLPAVWVTTTVLEVEARVLVGALVVGTEVVGATTGVELVEGALEVELVLLVELVDALFEGVLFEADCCNKIRIKFQDNSGR